MTSDRERKVLADGTSKPGRNFELTPDIITFSDLSKAIREAEKLDDFLHQAHLRSPGSKVTLPKITHSLENLAQANGFSLLDSVHRKHLIGRLRDLKTEVKKVNISFAVEPAPAVIEKIAGWFRENVDKSLVIDIGIQPSISVGCVVRTPNKVFDMSLRHRFDDGKQKLFSLMKEKSS